MPLSIPLDAAARLTLAQAAKVVGVAAPTPWRWAVKGNRYGVRLRTVVVGATRFTTLEFLEQFVCETTAAADGEFSPQPSKAKQQRIAAAKRELVRR